MTNWQPKETVVFTCPDCEHEQQEMTETCPACGNRRLPKKTSRHRLYELVFHSNLGNRKGKYRALLTKVQFRMLTELDDEDAYDIVQTKLWDRVIDRYTDCGCYFDAITFDAECLEDESKET
jgi:DNA-directed RNA polymerase subunit RPC12/RpoP